MDNKKIFILDTNVLLHDSNSIYQFEDNIVIIPIVVVEELDKFKKRADEVGRNCRMVSRELDELRKDGDLSNGCKLSTGGILKICITYKNLDFLPDELKTANADNIILATALKLQKENNNDVILVSKDINMRLKADIIGISAENYEKNNVSIDELYTGIKEVTLDDEQLNLLNDHNKIKLQDESLLANECLLISNINDNNSENKKYDLGYYDSSESLIRKLQYQNKKLWGIKARNNEQKFALELLMNPDIKLITLVGFAGTGKTLLALAAGLQQVINESKYDKLLVSRPIIPLGKDIGYLPGDVLEKLMPRMQPISDNLEFLFKEAHTGKLVDNELTEMIENGIIELEAVTYIRGRSIPDQFIIIDEAQNLTPHEIKTIITRAGNNTKVVITGDPYQIDHPYLDSNNNGLTYLVERFKGNKIFGHITLNKGERSHLAELAADILK